MDDGWKSGFLNLWLITSSKMLPWSQNSSLESQRNLNESDLANQSCCPLYQDRVKAVCHTIFRPLGLCYASVSVLTVLCNLYRSYVVICIAYCADSSWRRLAMLMTMLSSCPSCFSDLQHFNFQGKRNAQVFLFYTEQLNKPQPATVRLYSHFHVFPPQLATNKM